MIWDFGNLLYGEIIKTEQLLNFFKLAQSLMMLAFPDLFFLQKLR